MFVIGLKNNKYMNRNLLFGSAKKILHPAPLNLLSGVAG